MKIYVDELPKSCEKCPFHDKRYGICDISGSRVEYFGCHSLTPLSEHDKQVRKEMCEEIRKLSSERNIDRFYIMVTEILEFIQQSKEENK